MVQKSCKVHCIQKYIFKRSRLDFVKRDSLIFYLEVIKTTALI